MVLDTTPLIFQESSAGTALPAFTPAIFVSLMPEFTATDTATVQAQIDLAAVAFDAATWGQYYHAGLSNYIAHRLTIAEYTAKYGLAARLADDKHTKQVGSVMVGRNAWLLQNKALDPFMATVYGQEYRRLQRLVGAGARAI